MKFNLEATHDDDIYDLELKKVHIAFRELGVDTFPKDYINLPATNMDFGSIQKFNTGLQNTWLKRNKSQDNLNELKKALERAKKKLNKVTQ